MRVDLSGCEHVDSTFVGTLLVLKRLVSSREQGDFALVAPTPRCGEALKVMGLDGVFPLAMPEEVAGCRWEELPGGPADVEACKVNVVRAHEELAGLDGAAGAAFGEVVRCLREPEGGPRK